MVADVAVWGAYTAIPLVLLTLVLRRRDMPFPRLFWLFAAFIFACGSTHLIDAVLFWWPIYRVSAAAKVLTAVVSWATVLALIRIAPKVRTLPALARINEDLNREISERRRTEELLRESEERLRFMLSATRVGTWDWDLHTGSVRWSDNLETLHELPPGSFGGTHEAALALVHAEDRPNVEEIIARAIEACADFEVEYRFIRRNSAVSWMQIKAHVFKDRTNRPVRVAGICMDVSSRKQADARFRLAVEASPSAVVMVDEQGKIVLANSRVLELFGYTQSELIGRTIEVLVPERFRGHHPVYRGGFHDDPRARPMGAGRDLYGLRKDGSEVPVEIGLSPIRTDEGLMVLSTVVDITNRKQAEEERQYLLEAERAARNEAERANRLKDVFLANVSHELRTPLNAILGWSQLLGRHPLEGEAAQAVQIIERNAKVQAKLIEDLLDVSRIISGKIRLEMQTVDLALVANSAIEAVLPAAQVKNIEIERAIDATVQPVSGDPNRLQQVVWNLLSNAIKFTPRGGKVRVQVKQVGAHAEIAIRDNGIGMKVEFLPLLFDRFRQADSSTTRSYQGLGLGLSIVRHLVELHGGTVHGESEGEGCGSLFTVILPIALRANGSDDAEEPPTTTYAPSAWATGSSSGPSALGGVKVLVVDDDPDACVLAQRVLEDCGASVTTAGSAAQALRVFDPFRPDVIISDISMPEQDGYQFIQQIRHRESGKGSRTPAAALTAFTRPEDRARALLSGYQAHIAKPLTAAELIAVVASLTGRISAMSDSPSATRTQEICAQETAAAANAGTPPSKSLDRGRLLVVEDHRDVADLLKQSLEEHGYGVQIARSIAAALDIFDRRQFDLVICDLGLPDGSGLELMRQLLARRSVLGIALSGHDRDTFGNTWREAGFVEFLVKPAEEEDLLAAVERAMANKPD